LKEKPATAFIGLGSNLGDSIRILRSAWEHIGAVAGVDLITLSHPYITSPVDMKSSNWFTNAVGMLQTTLGPQQLLEHLLRVEFTFGRKRNALETGYQDRSLDLDILCIDGVAVDTPDLVLPHPRLSRRLFVLAPFAEIAPDYRENPEKPTIQERYDRLLVQIKTAQIPWQGIKKGVWEE
jgi:2-amino-4-hydroxy-6-hydroxymethyldihydropteridine diphosphokinase